jgi:hypothetical protein
MNPTAERRLGRRIVAQVPVQVRSATAEPEQAAHTRDLSTNGVFLYTQCRMAEGSEIEIVMILPAELTGEKRWVCCHATVVRVEENAGPGFGVAATIKKMDFLPEIGL